jgi:hypothetical protein
MTTYFGARIVLACSLTLSLFCPVRVRGGNVGLAWNPSSDVRTAGYNLYFGLNSGAYTSSLDENANLTDTVAGLTPGLTYYFAVTAYDTNGDESVFSNEVTNRLPILPWIIAQPLTQTAFAGAPVTLTVSADGDPPLSFQWVNGLAPIPGATASLLTWPQIRGADAGNYTVIVSNPWGSTTSSVAALTVIVPPSLLTQPQSQTVIATTPASFSSVATGTAPLSLQWYYGTTALAGATNSTLAWASVAAANAGSYRLTVSNSAGLLTSSVATLTVLPTNTIATAAGVYNGLFFQTNADGTPAVTEATSGFLGNCIVASNGAFSAKVYVGGLPCSLTGVFNISGNASATIPRTGTGLSNLTAVLHLDLFNGTREITGTISSTTSGNAWMAPLVADRATNACPQFAGVNFLLSPGLSVKSPTNFGWAGGVVVNGVLSLSGALGDTVAISQTVPISKDGNVPLYVSLYNNSGLLEGWINLAGGVGTGNLAWVRPSGVLLPVGFPQGFNTVVQVTGATFIHEENTGITSLPVPIGKYCYYMATKFTASSSYAGNGIQANLTSTGSPSCNLTAMIYTDSGGIGPGALVGSASSPVSASSLTGTETLITFSGSSFALVSGTSYWLVLKTSGEDGSNYVNWATTAYGTGVLYYSGDGTAWSLYQSHWGKFILFSQ